MQIWVDADACPAVVKDILFRAAERTRIPVTLVANQALNVPRSPLIRVLQVAAGFDVADEEIVRRVNAGDIVVTSDIPLAADALAKGAEVISPRGERHTSDSIRDRLVMRDFLDTLRASGIRTGGPAALSQADRKAFADQLDRLLARSSGAERI
ncbi:MAG: YaiI/YqxD family protein [Gammaproteobacteria bacterium]|jgi:uncharacterized protein YaiI (UPF0178 family)|nr:YaiI/YqxD family protein [Gammaproteobacteria bacterium]